jgi:streptomycin 6-kinase
LKPGGLHELPGIDFLEWRGGRGSVRLLARSENACLLEDAGTVSLRSFRLEHGEDASNEVVLAVLSRLHAASTLPPPATLVPLRQHFRALFDRAGRADVSELSGFLVYCAQIAEALLSSQTAIRPLHGDLHHDNIISGLGRGWLAIDPQGLIGDPAYDVANIFGNPEGAFPEIIGPRRITRLVSLFAPILGCSEEKILRYAIAHAGLSISWSLDSGDPITADGNAKERFAFLKVAKRLMDERAFSA